MDLRAHLDLVRRRWWSIAACAALGLAAAVALSMVATPVYTASAQLYVSVRGGTTSNDLAQGANFTRQQVTSYTNLAGSPLVLEPVIAELGLSDDVQELAARVRAESPVNTSLITITVSDSDAAGSARTADAVAEQFIEVIDDLEAPTTGGESPVRVTVVREATEPTGASSPDLRTNLVLGLLLGLVAGVAIAVLRELLDTRVRTEADLARVTEVPVVGSITADPDAQRHPLALGRDRQGRRAEEYRRLRTNVQFLDVDGPLRSVTVTSCLPGEGKSTTTINLALALADAGVRVALVDADLRRPAVADQLGLEGSAGLTTVLVGRAHLDDVLQPWGGTSLTVLTAGQVPPNPSELLGSRAMSTLLAELTARVDVVLIDSPPLLPVADAVVLSTLTEGTLLVAQSHRVHRQQLGEGLAALEAVGARVLGVVLNRTRTRGDSDAYGSYTAEPAAPAGRSGGRRAERQESRAASGRRSRRAGVEAAQPTAEQPVLPVMPAALPPASDGTEPRLWPGEPLGVTAPGAGQGERPGI